MRFYSLSRAFATRKAEKIACPEKRLLELAARALAHGFIEADTRGDGHVQALDGAGHRNGGKVVAAAAGQLAQAVTLGAEHYPTRDYGTFALPAGVYTSLRVTLGAGAGHNWWCVIFPPLCAQAAGLSERAVQALSDDDVRLVTESDGGYVVRFRLLELWDALVQRLS